MPLRACHIVERHESRLGKQHDILRKTLPMEIANPMGLEVKGLLEMGIGRGMLGIVRDCQEGMGIFTFMTSFSYLVPVIVLGLICSNTLRQRHREGLNPSDEGSFYCCILFVLSKHCTKSTASRSSIRVYGMPTSCLR